MAILLPYFFVLHIIRFFTGGGRTHQTLSCPDVKGGFGV